MCVCVNHSSRHKDVLGPTKTHFSPSQGLKWRGLKWTLRRVLNIFMPKNINCIIIVVITLEGIEEIKRKKNDSKN